MLFNLRAGIAAGLVAAAAPGALGQQFFIFLSRSQFNEFLKSPGSPCAFKGVEDFEESLLPVGGSAVLDDPLSPGVPNGPFLFGLSEPNIRVQSNTLGGAAVAPSPRGAAGLFTQEIGGINGDIVLANTLGDSLDLIFPENDKCAVGFETIAMGGAAGIQISVFNDSNGLVATQAVAAGGFFGIVLLDPHLFHIGRINIFGVTATGGGIREGADNISLWVDVPAPAGVLVIAAAGGGLMRRRRTAA
jgi:hypothetical protein